MHDTMKGNKVTGQTRAPKAESTDRLCARKGCDTKLSQYNRREYCYAHAPTRFPRLRGRIVTDS
jgi:hypothetical protein